MKKIIQQTLFIICILFSFQGCYSLNGVALDPTIKSIQIDLFPNYATLQNLTLSQNFTNDLRDKFRRQTSLIAVEDAGDIVVKGEITDYRESYTAVQADNTSSTRLTIRIKVDYTNTKDDTKSFTRNFEAYEDFSGSQTLTQAEATIVPTITENLINQVFNAIANDW